MPTTEYLMDTVRTYRAKILNHHQVKNDLDLCGFSASKLWNVGRHYIERAWEETGEIPNGYELKTELKDHERYRDLYSQSSQQVLEELAEAFKSWYNSNDKDDNPPRYRKRGNQHPRSTVTWKKDAIWHDEHNNRLRLSKGSNHKTKRDDYILCEFETRPDVTVEGIQVVRSVWNGDVWELHIVCKKEIEIDEKPNGKTAGIDLGINNYLAISYGNGVTKEIYPANTLKEDKHYFTLKEYKTEGENGPSEKALRLRRMLARRKKHFLHTLSKHIVEQCVEEDIGKIAIGDLSYIRKQEDGESRTWGKSGNKKLHGWEFEKFTDLLEYKAEEEGITVERIDENNTSKTCSSCGVVDGRNRIERGLYVCSDCGSVMNADVNGAENIRKKITQNPERDMSNGCVAQPSTYLFDRTAGIFKPKEQMSCKP